MAYVDPEGKIMWKIPVEIRKAKKKQNAALLDNTRDFLHKIENDNNLTPRELDKCYLCIAFEFFTMDSNYEGVQAFKKINPKYFEQQIWEDCRESVEYALVVKHLDKKLKELGIFEDLLKKP